MKKNEKKEDLLPKTQEIGITLKTLFSECEISENPKYLQDYFEKYNNLLKEETKRYEFLKYIVKVSSQALLAFEKKMDKKKQIEIENQLKKEKEGEEFLKELEEIEENKNLL